MKIEIFHELPPKETQSLTDVYTAVQEYSDGIRKTPEYHQALQEFDSGELPEFPAGSIPTVDFYLRRGVASAIQAVELLAIVTDPAKHLQLLKEFDEGIIPDHWIEQLVIGRERDTEEDDYGLGTLRIVKERDMNAILHKLRQDLDEQQVAGYKLHAAVVGRGHDFIITKYHDELVVNGFLPSED